MGFKASMFLGRYAADAHVRGVRRLRRRGDGLSPEPSTTLRFNPAAGRVAGKWGEHYKLLLCHGIFSFKSCSYQAPPPRQPPVSTSRSARPRCHHLPPSVFWTSTHGGRHHLRGSANCPRQSRARVLLSGYLPTVFEVKSWGVQSWGVYLSVVKSWGVKWGSLQ